MFSKCNYNSQIIAIITVCLLILLFHGACIASTQSMALPRGPIFSLNILIVLGLITGHMLQLLKVPAMLGMLLVGILLSNLPYVKDWTVLNADISNSLKNVSLIVILMRGGLGLDLMEVKRLSLTVAKLAFLPCLVEATVFAIMSVFLLQLPWVWAFMLGFVIAAVTPAIIVPCMIHLKMCKFNLDNGISTLLVSASSFDDVVAISLFMICLSTAFTTGKSLAMQIMQGPLEVLLGIIIGIFGGMLLWKIPSESLNNKNEMRTVMILSMSVFSVFGMNYVGFSGSGPLSVIIMSIVAMKGWGSDERVIRYIDLLWVIGEPLLFGLVGRDIDFSTITPALVWKTLIIIFVALFFRMLTAYFAVSCAGMTTKEKVFICFSWIPKATVQAAIGSYALGVAKEQKANEEVFGYARTIVTVAVLVILVAAPLGASLMYLTAPYLLSKKPEHEMVEQSDQEQQIEGDV